MVLVGTRLSEVRGFSDFFSEFFTALRRGQASAALRMVVLCSRPNYELRAFQAPPCVTACSTRKHVEHALVAEPMCCKHVERGISCTLTCSIAHLHWEASAAFSSS